MVHCTLPQVLSPESRRESNRNLVVVIYLFMPIIKLMLQVICQTPAVIPQSVQGTREAKMGVLLIGWLTEIPRERNTVGASGGKTAYVGISCSRAA